MRGIGRPIEVIDISDDDDDEIGRRPLVKRPLVALPPHLSELSKSIGFDPVGATGDPRVVHTNRPRRAFVNSSPLALEAYLAHKERNAVAIELCAPKTPAQMDADPRYRGGHTRGDDILKRLHEAIESFGMTRTFLQVTMHDLAFNVMGSAIYGDEWNQHRQRILEANNWRDYPPIMAAICARRFGKSTGAGQMASAALLAIPSCPVGFFAPTLRQATALLETTWDLLCRSSLFSEFRIKKTTATRIEIIGPDNTVRSLIAYPSTHKVRWVSFIRGAPVST